MFVCLTGIDGAGKTTQAKELVRSLQSRGIPATYMYARFKPKISYPALAIARYFFLKNEYNPDYRLRTEMKKNLHFRHVWLSRLYCFAVLSDYIIHTRLQTAGIGIGRKWVVCDRYVYDTVITDLAVDYGLTTEESVRLVQDLLRKLPKPDIVFLLDVPPDVALARKNDIASVDYLSDRREYYLAAAKSLGFVTIDATRDTKSIQEDLVRFMTPMLVEVSK